MKKSVYAKLLFLGFVAFILLAGLIALVDHQVVDELKFSLTLWTIIVIVLIINLVSFLSFICMYAAYRWVKKDLDKDKNTEMD